MILNFIDLFAGLGGFHSALKSLGHECVFASEIDPDLREIYGRNFKLKPEGDIRSIDPIDIPTHDILCAGFPCQPFSKAGFQLGWDDEVRGTLFGNIVEILKVHSPRYVILENVGNFERHDNGNTWRTVRSTLEGLGYNVQATEHKASGGPGLISPHHLGYPHHRERFFIVASMMELPIKVFPKPDRYRRTYIEDIVQTKMSNSDIQETNLSQQQFDCINHWNLLLQSLPESDVTYLPSFPIWGDEFGATYPYEKETPLLLTKKELISHLSLTGMSGIANFTKNDLLGLFPAYATRSTQFPQWKTKFIKQNRDWFTSIKHRVPEGWQQRLQEFPPSLRKLEWNCKGEDRDLWQHILQFRSSGLRVKRFENSPSLVSMTTTQIPILGPRKRFITRGEGLKLLGFLDDEFALPMSRDDTFKALGNAVHVGVVKEIVSRVIR